MAKALANLRDRLSSLPKWAVYAILIAVGIGAYYGFIGLQYRTASQELAKSDTEINQIKSDLRAPKNSEEDLKAQLEERTEVLEEWKALFSYRGYEKWQTLYQGVDHEGPNLLVIMVTDLANQNNVDLISYALSATKEETVAETKFEVQLLTITLGGDTHSQIYEFLSELHDTVPIFSIDNIQLSGFGGTASAKVGLLFYILAPESEVEADEA